MKTAIVDRIEGDKVILISEDQNVIKKLSDFDETVKEGDVVNLETLRIERQKTKDERDKVRKLLGKIF